MKEDASLSIYRFPLEQTLRLAPHTLNDEGEALVAQFGRMDDAGVAYTILSMPTSVAKSSSPPEKSHARRLGLH
jgi:hypothetical protein